MGLDTLVELGRMHGCHRPEEDIMFAMEAEGVETFGETRPAHVARVLEGALAPVREQVVAE